MNKADLIWNEYLQLEQDNIRSLTIPKLNEFIDILIQEDKLTTENWVEKICKQKLDEEIDIKIRMPLFEKIIFPILLSGYKDHKPNYARWLSQFNQYIYQKEEFKKALGKDHWTEYALLREAVKFDADDNKAKLMLIKVLAWQTDYNLHELPTAVLGFHSDNVDRDYEELYKDLIEFEDLILSVNLESDYKDLLSFAKTHYTEYRKYVKELNKYESYQIYCEVNKIEY